MFLTRTNDLKNCLHWGKRRGRASSDRRYVVLSQSLLLLWMPYVSAFDDHCDIALFCWHRVQQQRMRSGQRSVYKLNWRIVGVARWNREKTKRAVIAIKSLRFNCHVSSSLSISLTVTPNAQFWSRKFQLLYSLFPINFNDIHFKSSNSK